MLVVDRDAHEALLDGQVVHLTATEFRLLSLLEGSPRRVFTRAQILESVWGAWYGDDHVLDVVVHTLRKKVGKHYIRNVRSVGFRYEPQIGAA